MREANEDANEDIQNESPRAMKVMLVDQQFECQILRYLRMGFMTKRKVKKNVNALATNIINCVLKGMFGELRWPY